MVDPTHSLTNQLLLERFRTSYGSSYFPSYGAIPKSWNALLFSHESRAIQRFIETGYYGEKEIGTPPLVSPNQLVRLGLSLVEILNLPTNLVPPSEHRGKDSLLSLACAHLLWGDTTEGHAILEQLRNPSTRWITFIQAEEGHYGFTRTDWVNPTTPNQFNLEPFEFKTGGAYFGISHLSWIGPNTAFQLLGKCDPSISYLLALAQYHNTTWGGILAIICEAYARKEQKNKRVNYDAMADALHACSPRFFTEYMERATGVRIALGAIRLDASDYIFSRALRKMTTKAIIESLGGRISRPLKLKDLPGISAETLVQLLWMLPWELIEPLATSHHDQVSLKFAKLIDKPEFLDMIRDCLVDHPKRLDRSDPQACLNDTWEENIRPSIEDYVRAKAFREEVLETGLTRDHLLLLSFLPEEPNLIEVAKTFDTWPLMERFLSRIPQHLIARKT